jgi:beta-N-acetylhexosaminidase
VLAILAGCDAVLVCKDEDEQDAAVDALVREAEKSPTLYLRCPRHLPRA